jgi:hypothetical protein
MMIDPPTPEQWERLPIQSRLYILLLVLWHAGLPALPLPLPVHFGILMCLTTFMLLPILPDHPMSIPIGIGGGICGALLLVGRKHAGSESITTK